MLICLRKFYGVDFCVVYCVYDIGKFVKDFFCDLRDLVDYGKVGCWLMEVVV